MKNDIINKIEFLWNGYFQKQSDSLFNYATDMFIDNIKAISFCKLSLDKLKKDYPFKSEEIIHYESIFYHDLLKENSNMQILSFFYQWYEAKRNSSRDDFYYKKCRWLFLDKKVSDKNKIKIFKTDIIRPIIDYIIYDLNDVGYVLYLLDRYKQRVKYFKKIKNSIKHIGSKTKITSFNKQDNMMTTNESKLQEDLCLFLFDNGIDVHKEEIVGNGRLDVMINHNKNPFIVEVKYIKKDECHYKERINRSVIQLKEYMLGKGAKYGCIFIYTEVDIEFIAVNKSLIDIQLHSIYIGDKSPSQRTSNYFKISIK